MQSVSWKGMTQSFREQGIGVMSAPQKTRCGAKGAPGGTIVRMQALAGISVVDTRVAARRLDRDLRELRQPGKIFAA
jgi:hypothetical protein